MPDANFTLRVVCSNCWATYEMQFPFGTRFEQRGFGSESYLVITAQPGLEGPIAVRCRECGDISLSRKPRELKEES